MFAPEPEKDPYRIYIVDDHPFVREWLMNYLEEQKDIRVCGQSDRPATAFEEIVSLRPDVTILDLSLHGGSGIELIKNIRAVQPKARILVLSMHDEKVYAERAMRAGAMGYVMKRETTGKIIEAIRTVLYGQIYMSHSLAQFMAQKSMGVRGSEGDLIMSLGDRELEVFSMIGQGYETRRIAEELNLSMKTVQAHCEHIKEKLKLSNATELIREAVRWTEKERWKG